MYQVAVPDYVTLSYEAIIWTSYLEQMNKIVERINWSDGSYWGEPNKFKFQSRIESFEDATEMADNERIVKTKACLKSILIFFFLKEKNKTRPIKKVIILE